MQVKLKNKHVLVTGGSRGIGKAIVYAMAKAGAKVGVHYHTANNAADRIKSELGNSVEIFRADLADALEVNSLFNEVRNKFGRIDVLVNNAGIALANSMQQDDVEWLDAWLKTMDVNLNAVGLLCKKAINHFLKTGGGRIINIASRSAHRGDLPEYMAYAASKGGMVAVTKTIARAYGTQGIRAFTIAPGFVKSDMTEGFIRQFGEEPAYRDFNLEKLTEPGDIAPLAVFLASGLADHTTGSTFDVNGGSYVR